MVVKEVAAKKPAADLPEGWRVVRFGDVVRNVDVAERKPLENGLERYVGLEHLDPESLHIKRWGLVEEGTSFTRKFVEGQVLFGKRRAYQRKAAVAEFDGICSGDILVFEPNGDDLIPELLPFIVQSDRFFEHALSTAAGSLSPRTKWKDLASYEFALPPKNEQHHVADILWAADDAINKSQRVIGHLRSSIGAAFNSYTQKHSDSIVELSSAVKEIIAGISPACSSEPADTNEYGVLKVSAVSAEGFLERENKALLSTSDFAPELEVRSGFLLVTRANALKSGVGRACIVQGTRSGLMLSDKTLRLVIDEGKANARFLLEALRTKQCRQYIEQAATGTEAKNISQAKLLRAPIPLPTLEVQAEVENLLYKFDQSLAVAQSHLNSSQSLKRRLISKFLEGPK